MASMFNPSLHKQRHQFVVDFIQRNKPKKVVDLGCGECSLLSRLKFRREIELLVGVDIDERKLRRKTLGLAPLSTDFLQPTFEQLRVELYHGSVLEKDARVRGFDLVTSIEVIEHLHLADVKCFSAVVFGYMAPKAVIISTPNSEFNPLLPGLSGFRHSDHKFEWTRAEFTSWALEACCHYGYEVEFTGVGRAPQGQQVGFCSQIAVFHRVRRENICNVPPGYDPEDEFSYTQLYSVNYPSLRDNNTLRRVLVSEVLYWTETLKNKWMEERSGDPGAEFSSWLAARGKQLHENQTTWQEYLEHPSDQCSTRALWDGEGYDHLPSAEHQQPFTLHSSLWVPLGFLCSCIPKVSSLSGSVEHLKLLLMDAPEVRLSVDGSAVIVNCLQQNDQNEKEVNDIEDTGSADACQFNSTAERVEDWEDEVYDEGSPCVKTSSGRV
ncbi:small RNA 2'-O-methyltransferase isoform X2 [Gouania willdenowi]|uniref:Small RNA 2'-O-methyltransferase n=2 Tax=Gouania willdenowi TaxID=441366 RepID=A0A8C5G9P6_GOUWI|nr:small RNA 2'-O-methyltransferase isoform X2 [Gouania willdenowi]XP_028299558.1 small RNA 2'-O-methyltransferase isoform X2 [Gouania willdenowi]